MTKEERFLSKIVKVPRGCWLWVGKKSWNGYGQFAIGHQRQVYAHRWSYAKFRGPIPEKHDIDHLCRCRLCVNPAHLEAVTRRENLLRGDTITARHAAKTHCPQGHEYSDSNTYRFRGLRYCRICRSAHQKASVARIKERIARNPCGAFSAFR